MFKTILMSSLLVLVTACSNNSSNSPEAKNKPKPTEEPKNPGSAAEGSAAVEALFKGQKWTAGSIVAVAAGPFFVVYFTKKAGYNCDSRPSSQDYENVVSLNIPNKVKNYGPMNTIQMTTEQIGGLFYETLMAFFPADSADVNITEITSEIMTGEIKVSSGDRFSIAGKFSALVCLK